MGRIRGFPAGSREFPTDPLRMPIPEEQARLAAFIHAEGRGLLDRYRGLNGLGVGHKIVRGKSSGRYCLTFLAPKKLPERELPAARRIPRSIRIGRREVPTDVIHVGGPFKGYQNNQRQWQPRLRGGVSVGPIPPVVPPGTRFETHVGTLTGVFKPLSGGQRRYFVTNHHVADEDNIENDDDGQVLQQPGPEDTTGRPNDLTLLGDIDQAIPISPAIINPATGFNFVDFAKGRFMGPALTARNGATVRLQRNGILRAPDLRGFIWPTPWTPLVKAGRTTGTTWGVSAVVHSIIFIFYDGAGPYFFMDQCIGLIAADEGDSGAAVTTPGGLFAGQLYGGFGPVTLYSPFYWLFLLGGIRT